MEPNTKYDYFAKITLIGDTGVGKTCIIQQFCGEGFNAKHIPTIGFQNKIYLLIIAIRD